MGIFDDSGHFGKQKNDTRTWSEKIAGTRANRPPAKKAISELNKGPVKLPSGPSYGKNKESSGPINYNANNPIANIIRRNRGQSAPQPAAQSQSSLFDELLGKITSEWSGIDKSKIDYSPLDEAFNARLGALNGLRDTSKSNFDKSDANLESMHNAFQNHISTEGANRFNNIADTQKQNLSASNDISQNNLQQIKADDMAKRQAMLQNLGIEAAGAQEDSSANVLNQTIGSIESRKQADLANADQDRASNLAYNQGIATSVGQQGVERRGDLAQQLQAILGRVDMAQADATAENAQQRFQLEQGAGDKQYNQWRDNKGFMQDTLGMLQQDAMERDKMAMQGQDPRELSGFAGIPLDLRNSGYQDPEIQKAMRTMAQVMGSDDYLRESNSMRGNDKVAVIQNQLIANGLDEYLAFQLATNYANLGNTSKYEDRPY